METVIQPTIEVMQRHDRIVAWARSKNLIIDDNNIDEVGGVSIYLSSAKKPTTNAWISCINSYSDTLIIEVNGEGKYRAVMSPTSYDTILSYLE